MRRRTAFLLVVGVSIVLACRPARSGAEPGRLDPALLRLANARPDSVVGLLVQTRRAVDPAEQKALEAAGLTIGSAVADVVSGRAAAGRAPRIAGLPFVLFVELARTATVR